MEHNIHFVDLFYGKKNYFTFYFTTATKVLKVSTQHNTISQF